MTEERTTTADENLSKCISLSMCVCVCVCVRACVCVSACDSSPLPAGVLRLLARGPQKTSALAEKGTPRLPFYLLLSRPTRRA